MIIFTYYGEYAVLLVTVWDRFPGYWSLMQGTEIKISQDFLKKLDNFPWVKQ